MSVCEGLFDDQSVRGVVVEGIAESGGFGRALSSMVIACRLDDLAELAVGTCEAGMGLLDVY